MEKRNKIAWVIRIIVFILFVVSAITKMIDPLWMFEKQLVDLGICDWCLSHYLARLLIGFELALGIAILFPHLLKKLVIPVTIALLLAFCGHLIIQMIEFGPMNGNCGCFGQAIPMTPLEAFIKNVITVGLLVWLYRLLPSKKESWKNIIYPILIFLLCSLFMFMKFPFCPCKKKVQTAIPAIIDTIGSGFGDGMDTITADAETIDEVTSPTNEDNEQRIKDSIAKAKQAKEKTVEATETETAKVVEDKGPKPVVSKFAAFPVFSGKTVKVDEGKKTICMFAPGCDHCQNTAKELFKLSKQGKTPPVYIYFMDEEPEKIPEFFKIAGTTFPYQVLGIGDFWDMLGNGSTPGVFAQHNGNTIQSYEGINENEFDLEKFKKFALPKK